MSRLRVTNAKLRAVLLVAVVAAMFFAGGAVSDYQVNVLTTLLIYIAVAQGWNLLGGFGGQISLGSALFVGVGGYTSAELLLHTGLGWQPAVLAAGLICAAFGALLAVPLLRLRGMYFAVGTLAAAVVLGEVASNWNWLGGVNGLLLPIPKVPTGLTLYRAAVVVAGLSLLAILWAKSSRFGLRLRAVRDHEDAASGLGVSAFAHRALALIISAFLIGVAGGLVALQSVALSPDIGFAVQWSLYAVLMTVVGGSGTFFGPIVGALIIYYGLTEQLQNYADTALIVQGVVLVAVVRFAPQGLWPFVTGQLSRLTARLTGRGKRGPGPVSTEDLTDPARPESTAAVTIGPG